MKLLLKLRSLLPFLVCAVSFYIFLTFGLYLHGRFDSELPRLQRTQNFVDAYLYNRIPPETAVLAPLSRVRLNALTKIMAHKTRDWNRGFAKVYKRGELLSPAFSEHSALIVSRKGKVKRSTGLDYFSGLFPKNWHKQLMMGLYRGGKVFDVKIPFFFPRPISYREFIEWEGQLTPLYHKKSMAFLYHRVGDYCWFYLLDMGAISDSALNKAMSLALASEFGLSSRDAIQVFQNPVRSRALDSLLWGYLKNLSDQIWISAVYVLFLMALFFTGWFDKIVSRFSLKYGIFYFTVRSLLITVLIYLFYRLQTSHEIQLQVNWRDSLSNKVALLENGQQDYEKRKASRMKALLESDFQLAIQEFKETLACTIYQDGTVEFAPIDPPELFRTLILQSVPAILDSQSHYIKVNREEIRKKILKIYGETKVLGLTEFKDTEAIEKVFRKEMENQFYPFELSKTPFFFYWSRGHGPKGLNLKVLMIQRRAMLSSYFQTSLQDILNETGMQARVYYSKGSQDQHLELVASSYQETESYEDDSSDYQGSQELIRTVHREDGKWYQMTQKSLRYQQYLYLFRIPEEVLLENLKGPAFWFRIFQALSLILGILAWRFLTNSLTNPLKKIEERITALNNGEDPGKLHLHRMDEYRYLVQAYNESREKSREVYGQ